VSACGRAREGAPEIGASGSMGIENGALATGAKQPRSPTLPRNNVSRAIWVLPARRRPVRRIRRPAFVPYVERRIINFPATETIHPGVTLSPRIIAHARVRGLLWSLVVDVDTIGGEEMSLARTLYGSVCGSLGMLIFAGTALAPADIAADSIGTNSVEPSSIDRSAIDSVDECMAAQSCIDRYLWSLYQRTRKVDTVKVPEQIKVSVKLKGKTKIVSKTITKVVDEDFTWKDLEAAKRAGMSIEDYVIGGMDPNFRVTLYHALRSLDDSGLMPGIMCAFRDDYRQTIATGLKAQSDRSYHGGSFRGGYGRGLAVDIVSVKGETRAEQLASSQQLWKWVDTHEKELGIGRPYLDRDPPHVGPVDGEEYAAHRLQPNTQHAQSKAKKHSRLPLHNDRSVSKRAGTAGSSRQQSRPQTRSI
jgi:hypothetical protein